MISKLFSRQWGEERKCGRKPQIKGSQREPSEEFERGITRDGVCGLLVGCTLGNVSPRNLSRRRFKAYFRQPMDFPELRRRRQKPTNCDRQKRVVPAYRGYRKEHRAVKSMPWPEERFVDAPIVRRGMHRPRESSPHLDPRRSIRKFGTKRPQSRQRRYMLQHRDMTCNRWVGQLSGRQHCPSWAVRARRSRRHRVRHRGDEVTDGFVGVRGRDEKYRFFLLLSRTGFWTRSE